MYDLKNYCIVYLYTQTSQIDCFRRDESGLVIKKSDLLHVPRTGCFVGKIEFGFLSF